MKNSRFGFTAFFLLACCLLFLLAACGSTPVAQGNQIPTTAKGTAVTNITPPAKGTATSTVTPQATTIPMPPTQTSCPANGTARAAVMRPLALSADPSLVYIYNDVPQNTSTAYGILKRYDVKTGQKQQIVMSGLSIDDAHVSADGQWVLFTSRIDPRGDPKHFEALQLVRIDGQGLQTLYCSKQRINQIQWSTNQLSIAFSFLTGTGSEVNLLNITNGALLTEFSGNSPLVLRTWLDNTHLYLTNLLAGEPNTIYLLDTRKGPNQTMSDLTTVYQANDSSLDFDSSFDASKVYITTFKSAQEDSLFGPSSITVHAAAGGQSQSIYASPAYAITNVRAVTSTTLLLLIDNVPLTGQQTDTSHNGLWKMNKDGTGLTRLTTNPVRLNTDSQYPWSNVSRDNSLYAFESITGNQTSLMVASLSGGNPTEFASTVPGSVSIVGWTTM